MTRRTLLRLLLLGGGCWILWTLRTHPPRRAAEMTFASRKDQSVRTDVASRPVPQLTVTPLVGMAGQHATAQVTGLSTPANPEWRWARLVVESPDGSTPIDSLWPVPSSPQTRTWTLRGEGLTIISLALYTHNTEDVAWRTEYLLDTHEPNSLP